jgi:hypothetical protein
MHLAQWLARDRGEAAPAATVCVREARPIARRWLLVCPGVPVCLTRPAWPRRGPAGARRLTTCRGAGTGAELRAHRSATQACTVQRTTICVSLKE